MPRAESPSTSLTPPPAFVRLLRQVADDHCAGNVDAAAAMFFSSILSVVDAKGRRVPQLTLFYEAWAVIEAERLRRKAKREEGAPEEQTEEDKELAEIPADFDQSILTRDSFGFVGVQAMSKGRFRAVIEFYRGGQKQRRVCTRRATALRAAHDRYVFFRAENLPYTPWEQLVCNWPKNKSATMDDFTVLNQCVTWMYCVDASKHWDIMPEWPPTYLKEVGSHDRYYGHRDELRAQVQGLLLEGDGTPASPDYQRGEEMGEQIRRKLIRDARAAVIRETNPAEFEQAIKAVDSALLVTTPPSPPKPTSDPQIEIKTPPSALSAIRARLQRP